MKKRILGFLLAVCLIVPAISILSACSEKQYDIEITTNTQIAHIQEIRFSSSSTNKTTYRNSEPTYLEVICDQGYAPNLVFSVGDLIINEYSDYFYDMYYQTDNPDYDPDFEIVDAYDPDNDKKIRPFLTIYTGVLYTYTIPTKDLTGKQTVTYNGGTKAASVRLNFNLDKGGDDVDPFDGDYEGLSFEFKGLAGNKTRTFTAEEFIAFTNKNGYLMLDYNKPATITLKSDSNISNYASGRVFYIYEKYNFGEASDENSYTWTVKSDINFDLTLTLERLKEVNSL